MIILPKIPKLTFHAQNCFVCLRVFNVRRSTTITTATRTHIGGGQEDRMSAKVGRTWIGQRDRRAATGGKVMRTRLAAGDTTARVLTATVSDSSSLQRSTGRGGPTHPVKLSQYCS